MFAARVRLRAKLDYADVQQAIDVGSADPMWEVRRIGELRRQCEQDRGGISLKLPEQEISAADGRWKLAFRARMAIEDWNEQIFRLTGMAAAHPMVQAKVGLPRVTEHRPAQDSLRCPDRFRSVTSGCCSCRDRSGAGGIDGQRDSAVVLAAIMSGALGDLAIDDFAVAYGAHLVLGHTAVNQEITHRVGALHA